MKVKDLNELYVEELKDLYSAESQLVKALPKIARAVVSQELSEAIEAHLEETRGQVTRLEQVLSVLGEDTEGPACEAMEGILKEGSDLISEVERGPVRDAALVGAGQKVEHYEIAAYTGAIRLATQLGFQDQAAILEETLQEELAADGKLSQIGDALPSEEEAIEQGPRD